MCPEHLAQLILCFRAEQIVHHQPETAERIVAGEEERHSRGGLELLLHAGREGRGDEGREPEIRDRRLDKVLGWRDEGRDEIDDGPADLDRRGDDVHIRERELLPSLHGRFVLFVSIDISADGPEQGSEPAKRLADGDLDDLSAVLEARELHLAFDQGAVVESLGSQAAREDVELEDVGERL